MARFVLAGRSAARLLSSAPSDLAAPTQAELSAGVDLVGTTSAEELYDIQGWEVEPTSYPTPGFASLEVGNVAGPQNYPDSSLAWYKDTVSATIYTAVAAETEGYVVLMLDGQAATEESELFVISIASRVRDKALDAAHGYRANMTISAPTYGTQAA